MGPSDSVKQAIYVTQEFNVDYVPLVYETHESIVPMIGEYLNQVDGLLFTGRAPYEIAIDALEIPCPIKYVQHDISTLQRTLFYIRHHHNLEISQFSIDLFKLEEVKEAFEELDIPFDNVYVTDFDLRNLNGITDYHLQLYNKGEIKFCITSFLTSLEELKENGVPCFRVVPTKFAIRNTFELLMLEINSRKSQEAQISVGIFNVDNFKSIVNDYSEYELQRMKLKLYDLILKYGMNTQSSVVFSGADEYVIYSTKGQISRGITGQDSEYLLEQIRKNIPVSYGIGEGYTANEATNNARIALRKAKSSGGNCSFIRKMDGVLIGPLGTQNEIEYSTGYNEKIEEISKKVGISSATLSKISVLKMNSGKDMISANELGDYYGCTLRSARRMLATLVNHGFAEIVKFDQPFEKGRPRRYYKLYF